MSPLNEPKLLGLPPEILHRIWKLCVLRAPGPEDNFIVCHLRCLSENW